MKNKTNITDLLAQHAQIYRELVPTLDKYQDMAKRALELQVQICDARFSQAFPDAAFEAAPLIITLSARETPAKVDGILAELSKKKITVTQVIFDPQTFSYHLYGQ